MQTPHQGFHPELRGLARFLPRGLGSPWLLALMRRTAFLLRAPRLKEDVQVEDVRVAGPAGAPPVRVRLYTPRKRTRPTPALLWIHGGGYLFGKPEQDERLCAHFAQELGIVVASVDYRLAPENPFPAPLEDCYAALKWLGTEAGIRGVRADRLAVGGASAGGGLAAALAQLAHDRGEVRPVFQLLVYPMLDDRTAVRAGIDGALHRLWDQKSNLFGWKSYLGMAPGAPRVPEYAAPARRESVAGLPAAWIGVGTADLFHDEDLEYARRLEQAGVPCELHVVPGAHHGFDIVFAKADVTRTFRDSHVAALRRALFPGAAQRAG
jgi:acetyl esterase/lipase